MEENNQPFAATRLHTRFLAACFAFLLALSMGCGISVAALADDFEDLDSPVQDSLILGQEEVAARTLPAKPVGRIPADVAARVRALDDLSASVASTPSYDYVPYIQRNGGRPCAIHPTGPPLRA